MSEPKFDFNVLATYFATATQHDKADPFAQPRFVNLKLGYYLSYEIMSEHIRALKKAKAENKPEPAFPTRTVARSPAKTKLSIPGTSSKFVVPMKYYIEFADITLASLGPSIGPPFEFDTGEYLRQLKDASKKFLHLTVTRTIGDAVHDTNLELHRCGFRYHYEISKMTQSARETYRKNLSEISAIPSNMEYSSGTGMHFMKMLAKTCTYDAEGEWFRKWTKDAENNPKRTYIGPNLDPSYLHRATGEYELEQGYYYAYLLSEQMQRLYRLTPSKTSTTGYKLDLLVGLDDSQLIPPTWNEDADSPNPDLIIFRTLHGPKDTKGSAKQPTFKYHDISDGANHRLADPQREVESDLGVDGAKKTGARTDYDWFVELAKIRFTEKLYPLDITSAIKNARLAGHQHTMLDQYREKLRAQLAPDMWEWAGQNRARLKSLEPLQRLFEDETKLAMPQGQMITKNVKFVGADHDFAYARNLELDITIKIPLPAFIAQLAENEFYTTLYKNTEGMIYISQIIVWGGLVAMGIAIIPGVLAVRTVVRAVANRLRKALVDKAVKQFLIMEIPAMAAMVAEFVAGLFVHDYKDAEKWESFARGFFRGYATNMLKKIFFNITNGLAEAVLKEYYLYKRIKKLHATVKQLNAKFDELSGKLTKQNVTALVVRFEEAAAHSMSAALVLFQLIAYLDHGDANDVVTGLLSALNNEADPKDALETLRKEDWYKEAKDAVINSVVGVGEFMTGTGKKAFDAVDGVFKFVDKHEKELAAISLVLVARGLAKDMAAIAKAGKTKSSPKKIALVIGGLLGGGAILHFATDGKSTDFVADLGNAAVKALPGATPKDAEMRGQIYGTALGALFFDRGLIGNASALGKLAERDKIAKRTRKHLRHGIIMPILSVVFQRYVIFFRKALGHDGQKGDIEELLNDVMKYRTDEYPQLRQFESKSDTGADLHGIMHSILNIERFLNTEVQERWKAKWGPRIESYGQDLEAFRGDMQDLGVEELVKKHAPIVGFTLLTQFRVAIRSIRLAFESMAKSVDVQLDDGSQLTIIKFIEMLGFDLGNLDADALEFDTDMGEIAKGFKPEAS